MKGCVHVRVCVCVCVCLCGCCYSHLLSLLLLLLLLHALLDLTQQAGGLLAEALQAVLVRQLLQPGAQLPVGGLDLAELQLALTQLHTHTYMHTHTCTHTHTRTHTHINSQY